METGFLACKTHALATEPLSGSLGLLFVCVCVLKFSLYLYHSMYVVGNIYALKSLVRTHELILNIQLWII